MPDTGQYIKERGLSGSLFRWLESSNNMLTVPGKDYPVCITAWPRSRKGTSYKRKPMYVCKGENQEVEKSTLALLKQPSLLASTLS